MTARIEIRTRFIQDAGWGSAASVPLAGDASNRKYLRLTDAEKGATVLMDADPQKGEDVRPFVLIAKHLADAGLSAPKIFAADVEQGFLIIEDLGDALYDRVVNGDPGSELEIYLAAWDALKVIWATPLPPDIAPYDPADMAQKAALVAQWYDTNLPAEPIVSALQDVLEQLDWSAPTLALRDFHAQNLLWLPDRKSAAQVGLLDFQDAQPSHVLYDVVSLLYDARRDVADTVRAAVLTAVRNDTNLSDFDLAAAALLVQRSLRILGVFARLWVRDGKPDYLELIPRVYGQLMVGLAHPGLAPVAAALSDLAAPDDNHIAHIRSRR